MEKELLTFEEFTSNENFDDYTESPEEEDNFYNFLDSLEESNLYIKPDDYDYGCGWNITEKLKTKIRLHKTDEIGDSIVPCFVYIHNFGICSLESCVLQQGTGYDSDLDEIYAIYKKREDISGVLSRLKNKFNELVKEYKLYKKEK